MYLQQILLHNWKLYGGEHQFDFPEPGKRQNVILIGAKNGYGKTSLLEAIALGLYGRDGLDIVARADTIGDDDKRRQGYRRFIEGAWYERARHEGETDMSVELVFHEADTGKTIGIRRTWHFTVEGRLLGDGETVAVEVDGQRKGPGKHEDRDDFYRNLVAKTALPAHLAQFFLFDGERVQNLAKRDMATQVRMGIEGFLGVKLMRDLASDLGVYAGAKRSEVKTPDSEAVNKLSQEIAALDARIGTARSELEAIEKKLKAAEKESESLQGRLSSMGGGSVKTVQRLAEQKSAVKRTCDVLTTQLTDLVGGDFALALAGHRVRGLVQTRLAGERKLAASRAAIESSKGRIGFFINSLATALPAFEPGLSPLQQAALEQKVAGAWHSIWHPPEDGCASDFRHGALSDLDRVKVQERLGAVERLSEEGIADLLHRLNDAREEEAKLEAQINTYAGIEDSLADVAKRLDDASKQHGQAKTEKDGREREIKGLEIERQNKNASLKAQQAMLDEARPFIARAELAEKVKSVIDPFIDEAVGECVDDIATRMTAAFKEMAHKTHVDRITIDRNCEVRLLTKSGEDIRSLDQSAGENQIFAFALISAISQAADIRFPLIVDTPLARLDAQHRTNVLRHFTQYAGEQIVFLSQDTEIVREFKEAISTKIKKTFRIENDPRPGSKTGRARVVEHEYF